MRAATASLLGVLSAVAVGCGNEPALLGASDAAGLKDTLSQVRSAVDGRDCSLARARLRELRSEVGNLPGSVNRELRVSLRQEIVTKLAPAVRDECDDVPKTEKVPTTTESAPTGPTGPADPKPTEPTVTTETTEEPPPPEDTTETTPAPPVDPGTTTPGPQPVPRDPTRDPGGFGDSRGGDG